MAVSILNKVRTTCKFVSNRAKLVKISDDRISALASKLDLRYSTWEEDTFHFSDLSNENLIAQYVFVLDALNFCFW